MTTQYSDQKPLRLYSPGELIAAIPAMLGFNPDHSLVALSLVGTSSKRIGSVLRHDVSSITGIPSGQLQDISLVDNEINDICDRVARLCAREPSAEVVVVLIGGSNVDELKVLSQSEFQYSEIAKIFYQSCIKYGVRVLSCYYTKSIRKGQEWSELLSQWPASGYLPDPECSVVAAAQVFDGRMIHKSREELAKLLELQSQWKIDEMTELLNAVDQSVSGSSSSDSGSVSELIIGIISDTSSQSCLTAEKICTVALALRDHRVRDIMFGLAMGDKSAQSEQVWTALARVLPAPDRAEAATLLAHSAYIRGDGVLAGMALEVALAANPEHRMARMLDTALHHGISPQQLREVATTSFDIAEQLGVTLPPNLYS